ncbi:MAG: hypothetical protein SGILL_003055 [Bacillariaceae sp.]
MPKKENRNKAPAVASASKDKKGSPGTPKIPSTETCAKTVDDVNLKLPPKMGDPRVSFSSETETYDIPERGTETTEEGSDYTPRTPHFQRVRGQPDTSKTPNNQTITVTYEDLCITPTKMKDIDTVFEQIDMDDFWHFDTKNASEDLSLLVFLYGKGYFNNLPREQRIASIEACISAVGGNRKRLIKIVLSKHHDRIMRSENGFNVYSRMATTCRLLFGMSHAKGGFPKEVYLRNQGLSRHCYIVAVAMFLTIHMQRCNPECDIAPIDTGWLARRFVIDSVEGLTDRVIKDKGSNGLDFLVKVLGEVSYDILDFDLSDSPNRSSHKDQLMASLWGHLKNNEAGLVTSFHVPKKFQEVDASEKFGVHVFDGDTVDCEPWFMEFKEREKKTKKELDRLKVIWDSQLEEAERFHGAREAKMEALMDISPRGYVDPEKDEKEQTVVVDRESTQLYSIEVTFKDQRINQEGDTLGVLKEKLAELLNFAKDVQSLTFEGKELCDDDELVENYGIGHKSIICVKDILTSNVRVVSVLDPRKEPTHAMVLIGVLSPTFNKRKRLYILWNSWPNMPLVAVSLDYLIACRCKITFLKNTLNSIEGVKSANALACDCAPVDHAEDTRSFTHSYEDY